MATGRCICLPWHIKEKRQRFLPPLPIERKSDLSTAQWSISTGRCPQLWVCCLFGGQLPWHACKQSWTCTHTHVGVFTKNVKTWDKIPVLRPALLLIWQLVHWGQSRLCAWSLNLLFFACLSSYSVVLGLWLTSTNLHVDFIAGNIFPFLSEAYLVQMLDHAVFTRPLVFWPVSWPPGLLYTASYLYFFSILFIFLTDLQVHHDVCLEFRWT